MCQLVVTSAYLVFYNQLRLVQSYLYDSLAAPDDDYRMLKFTMVNIM